jgi:hypothetical protein
LFANGRDQLPVIDGQPSAARFISRSVLNLAVPFDNIESSSLDRDFRRVKPTTTAQSLAWNIGFANILLRGKFEVSSPDLLESDQYEFVLSSLNQPDRVRRERDDFCANGCGARNTSVLTHRPDQGDGRTIAEPLFACRRPHSNGSGSAPATLKAPSIVWNSSMAAFYIRMGSAGRRTVSCDNFRRANDSIFVGGES